MQPETRKLLFDIQQAALGIQAFVDGRTLEEFEQDLMLRSAVERQFEIIGEAMRRLRERYSAVFSGIREADRIISFRNVLTHGYDAINNATTWSIIHSRLPLLVEDVSLQLK